MKKYAVIVIGAGHAGVEACLVTARMGLSTALITLDEHKIALMPCNPSIGGPAKGIVVREIDALGGEMAKAADATALQIKLLNSSRGPAVWALRAQSDKIEYSKYMEKVIYEQENLTIISGIVEKLLINEINECYGVKLQDQTEILAQKVIITAGTYLHAVVLRGKEKTVSGPDGSITTKTLSYQLKKLGIELFRLKTGTPPRIKRDSIDFSKTKEEPGTDAPLAFSYQTKKFLPIEKQELCWLIHSTAETHKIVQENLLQSATYSGNIKGKGPRYCPSFEDKIVRFADKPCHQIFLEPESKSLDTIYVQGFSTSMPINVQKKMIHSLPGLEHAEIKKYAYAIEYDAIVPTQLWHTLELKIIKNLYSAGQINGTSGYEEAACQGLMAGINAALAIKNLSPLILHRDEAYIGVLIDDLVTKGTTEPYRLLTSRAEFRLLLRNDNAEKRLKDYAHQLNLINSQEWKEYTSDCHQLKNVIKILQETFFTNNCELYQDLNTIYNINLIDKLSAYQLLKRPDIDAKLIIDAVPELKALKAILQQNILINIRFEGYIKKDLELANKVKKLEEKKIRSDINYDFVANLSLEAREKLSKIRPTSIGQATRISGISPADIQMLLFFLKKEENKQE